MRATRLRAANQDRRELPPVVAWSYVGLAVLLALMLVVLRDTDFVAVPLVVAGVGSTGLILFGRARNRPSTRLPWTLFAASCSVFIVGAVLRQLLVDTPLAPLADVGEPLRLRAGARRAFIAILRTRGVSRARAARAAGRPDRRDRGRRGGVGGLHAADRHLRQPVPLRAAPGRVSRSSTSASCSSSCWWPGRRRNGSRRTGSSPARRWPPSPVTWATPTSARRATWSASPLQDLPFVFGFALLGAAALHPSMAALSRGTGSARPGLVTLPPDPPRRRAPPAADRRALLVALGGRSLGRGHERPRGGAAGAVPRCGRRPGLRELAGGASLPGDQGRADRTGQPAPPRRPGRRSDQPRRDKREDTSTCCSSTSTGSSSSTTRGATTSVTASWSPRQNGCAVSPTRAMSSLASVATSSCWPGSWGQGAAVTARCLPPT